MNIYLARDNRLPRDVAIKLALTADDNCKRHIVRESAILAGLDNPNIIPVYDSNYCTEQSPSMHEASQNRPFLVMKLVRGMTLQEMTVSSTLGKRQKRDHWMRLLRLFADVCDAVQHAHNRGVVHGNLKPKNILIDQSEHPWLIDWGLSRVIAPDRLQWEATEWLGRAKDEVREITLEPLREGALVGILAYMAPEQARREGINEKTDLHALGATLFTLLTGRCRFSLVGNDWPAHLRLVAEGEGMKPRSVDSSIPRQLEKICLKAMARNANERHVDASELANDIRGWLS